MRIKCVFSLSDWLCSNEERKDVPERAAQSPLPLLKKKLFELQQKPFEAG